MFAKVGNLGVVHKTRLEGDHQSLTLGVLQIFYTTQPRGPTGPLKLSKIRQIPVSLNKSWEFWGHASNKT